MTIIKPEKLEGYFPERANCTVIALSVATKLPYDKCHEIAKLCGRKDNKGFHSKKLIKGFNHLNGKSFVLHKRSPITVQKFCKLFNQGTYFVKISGHAFCIIDGVAIDHAGIATPKARITTSWKFVQENPLSFKKIVECPE